MDCAAAAASSAAKLRYGISDPESIDLAWTRGTGAPKGPFRILDTVGLTTAHNIVKQYLKVPSFLAPYNFRGMDAMLREYIDAGKLGMASGRGLLPLFRITQRGTALRQSLKFYSSNVSFSSSPGLRRIVKSIAHGLENTSSLWPR